MPAWCYRYAGRSCSSISKVAYPGKIRSKLPALLPLSVWSVILNYLADNSRFLEFYLSYVSHCGWIVSPLRLVDCIVLCARLFYVSLLDYLV